MRLQRTQVLKARQYAAASVDRMTGDWIPASTDVNTEIRSSSLMVRARTRQLVRDFPYFANAVNILTNYVVGDGIQFQSRVKTPDGKYDKKINQKIEDALSWWMDEADTAGKLHYFELERLAKRQEVESGEYLLVKTWLKDSRRYSPFCLQTYEVDWLTDLYTKADKGNLVDQGIEYNPDNGQVVAYHFMIPDGFNIGLTGGTKSVRVLAEHVIHGFETLRPGQLRGISPFACAILLAHDLQDYLDAEIDGAKMAAKYLAFIKTNDPGGVQNVNSETDPKTGKRIEEMENCTIEYLNMNEDAEIAHHNRPGDTFSPFTKFILRMVSVATGVTYELLSGDYEGINYSNLRGIRNDLIKQLKPHVKRHIHHFTKPTIYAAMDAAVMSGRLDLPGYFTNPWHYRKAVFIPPGIESVDPLREGKAMVQQIQAGLRSPQEIVASRGRDLEEVLKEIGQAIKMFEEQGIPWVLPMMPTAMQQNPAKLGASENE